MAELLALSEAETEDCLSDMVSFNPLAVQGLNAVLRIRIHQIHMFLGLLDPDPSVIKQI